MKEQKSKDQWSEGGQVFYSEGWAWGVTSKGGRICLGTEEEIKEALAKHIRTGIPVVDNILIMEWNAMLEPAEPPRARMRRSKIKK